MLGAALSAYLPAASPNADAAPNPCGKGSGGAAVAYQGTKVVRAPKVPDACLYRTGFNAAEPTLGINKDGTIFVVAMNALEWPTFPTHTIRSTDGGESWEDVSPAVGPVRRHAYTEDPYLYVDPDTGRVFTNDFLLPCSETSYSDDDGATWTTVVMGCELADHQTIFAGPPVSSPTVGYPNVVYYCAAGAGVAGTTTVSACLKSLNGGLTFVATGLPAFTDDPQQSGGEGGIPGHCTGLHGHGVVGPDGTVYLPRAWCGQPWLAISHDEGLTWTRVQVADNGTKEQGSGSSYVSDHEAGVAVDRKGNLFYTWVARNRRPYLAVSKDGGETWSKPVLVAPPGIEEAGLPGIAAGGPGKVAIIYMGTTNAPDPPFEGANYGAVEWNGYITMTANALAKKPLLFTGSVNDPKRPLLRGTACGPPRCGAAYDFLDIVIGPDGTPWANFVDGCYVPDCDEDGQFLPNAGEAVIGRLVGGPSLK